MPLLLAAEGAKPGAVFRRFFLFSLASYLIILYWIPRVMVRYGGTSWLLGIVGLACLAAFFSLLAGLAGMLIGRAAAAPGPWPILWVPAIWVAKDLVIEKIISGFPWCLAGYSQYGNACFRQWAVIGGIHLVTFLLIAANVLIYRLLKKKTWQALLAAAAFLLAVHAGGYVMMRGHAARSAGIPWHHAGIIQPNSDHDRAYTFPVISSTLDELFAASRELKEAGAELVIWPEFTVPIYPLQMPYFKERFVRFAREYVPLLAGFTDQRGSEGVFNSAMLFSRSGIEIYDKFHLTPFGEYVLFRRWLFFVKKITDEIGDFTPGKEIRTVAAAGHPLATPICYEVIYPELVRAMIARGGEAIVTISNDSWFGDSSAPFQHLAMAVFRAIENRRWLLRSTSNGISALVDPGGRIVRRSPLHRRDRFLASFQYLQGRTLFNRWGYLFPYLCLLLVLGRLIIGRLRRSGPPHQP